MAWQIATTLLAYTPSLPSGASEASGHPATNVALWRYPLRTWRSQDLTSEALVLDFASAKTVRAVFLNTANFTSARIEVADNTGFSTNYADHGTFTIGRDRRVNRYKAWCAPASPVSRRYLRLTPSGVVGGAAYYELGALACTDTITALADDPAWPLSYTRQQGATAIEFPSGSIELAADGSPYLVMEVGNALWRKGSGILNQLADVLDLAPADVFLLHENLGDATKAYLFHRPTELAVEENFVVASARLTLREAI